LLTRYNKILQQLEDEANYERSARPRDLTKLEGVRFLLNLKKMVSKIKKKKIENKKNKKI